ncbi:AraC family transcriptional regulator [Marinomonas agarivorans]|nr:AraC family transcriptional regulator [Marinomonas agarivorans]
MEILYWGLSLTCLFLAVILFWQNKDSGRWLAYFMLFLSCYVGLSTLELMAVCISPVIYFLLLSIVFLPGPLLLGFIGHISTRKLISVRDFIPCCLPILTVLIASEQLSDKALFSIVAKDSYRQADYVAFFNIMMTMSGVYIVFYGVAAFRFVFKIRKDWYSYQSSSMPRSWFSVLQIISAVTLVMVFQAISAFLYPAGNEYSIGNLSLLLLTPCFIYQSCMTIYHHITHKEVVVIQHPLTYGEHLDEYGDQELSFMGKTLREKIVSEKLYLEINLSLAALAEYLGVTPHKLSEVINKEFKQSFYNFINDLRSHHAAKELKNNPQKPIAAVQYDSGFASKSTFYTYFKKHYGCTPKQYRDKLLNVELLE